MFSPASLESLFVRFGSPMDTQWLIVSMRPKGADTFPEKNAFAVCLEGYAAVSQTQKELKPWQDYCLKHTCAMEGSSPVD